MADDCDFAWMIVGAGVGILTPLSQRHPRRVLGLVPFAFTTLYAAESWLAFVGDSTLAWAILLFGAASAFLSMVRGCSGAYHDQTIGFVAILGILLFFAIPLSEGKGTTLVLPDSLKVNWLFAGAAAGFSWWAFLPQSAELLTELAFWPFYNVRAHGPGTDKIPRTGPLLIVANHSAYFDPLWLGKIVPRHITPMMTSLFYDLPGIHWLMVHVVGAIRVEESLVRREAPELHEAVAVLRQGGCIVVFPEAILRRTEERLLRPFGQGVWHILRELPQTPVVVCWIEGGWGSYFSYRGGPPGKNKRLDVRRPIDIAVEEARPLDPAVLVDHMTTRQYLRRAVAAARGRLGLPVPDDTGRVKVAAADEK